MEFLTLLTLFILSVMYTVGQASLLLSDGGLWIDLCDKGSADVWAEIGPLPGGSFSNSAQVEQQH